METVLLFVISKWPTLTIIALILFIGFWFLLFHKDHKVSWSILAIMSAVIIYIFGRKNGRDSYDKIAKDIQHNREIVYDKIDDRNTSVSDVTDRLRKGDY